jgi:hypothetical protein
MLLVNIPYLYRKDDLNNESFVTRTVNVVANQKPVITAAANINANSAAF